MEPPPEKIAEAERALPVLPNSPKIEPPAPKATATAVPPAAPPGPTPLDFGHAMHQSSPDLSPAQRSLEATIVEVLRTVYDPEIPVNIYELGLIYQIDIDAQNHVKVKMTLTAPGCPVAGEMLNWVQKAVSDVGGIDKVDVRLVFDPPWDNSRMSEDVQLELGLL